MPFATIVGYGSTTAQDSVHTLRGRIEAFAASDVVAGTPVKFSVASATGSSMSPISNPPGFFVEMCGSQNDEPLGFARDHAVAGGPVAVFDYGNIIRETVQGSVNLGQYVGVIGTGATAHPVSGATIRVPQLGAVYAASFSNIVMYGVSSTSTFSAVWAVGQALDIGNPGQGVAIRVNPRLLSGLG
jgi:hypothetical protein